MHIRPDTLYLVDNGAALCGEHLGSTAKYTGRDISGEPIVPVTGKNLDEAKILGITFACEECGKLAVPKGPIS